MYAIAYKVYGEEKLTSRRFKTLEEADRVCKEFNSIHTCTEYYVTLI